MDRDDYLTVDEVAARLKVSPEIVREWLRKGELGGFRLGGARAGWRVTPDDLAAFVERRRAEGQAGRSA
jgi:excisionase family DNA binding protein